MLEEEEICDPAGFDNPVLSVAAAVLVVAEAFFELLDWVGPPQIVPKGVHLKWP